MISKKLCLWETNYALYCAWNYIFTGIFTLTLTFDLYKNNTQSLVSMWCLHFKFGQSPIDIHSLLRSDVDKHCHTISLYVTMTFEPPNLIRHRTWHVVPIWCEFGWSSTIKVLPWNYKQVHILEQTDVVKPVGHHNWCPKLHQLQANTNGDWHLFLKPG